MTSSGHHGMISHRGLEKRGAQSADLHRFADLFPDLPRMIADPDALRHLGRPEGPMDEATGTIGSTSTPLGYVFLGQFIDHDMTLDVTSSFNRINDPDGIRNFRTPTLDLDCIYGNGPEASRHLYYHAPPDPSEYQKAINGKHLLTLGDDLVRVLSDNPSNINRAAVIGDPRNDENRVISQLQLAMHVFHNKVVDYLIGNDHPDGEVFEEARRLTRWHYQWVVVHDFLVRMVGKELVDDILCNGSKLYAQALNKYDGVFIPTEYAVAAYRFGHTMVRSPLNYNETNRSVPLFGDDLGKGFSANSAGPIDWKLMFGSSAQSAGSLDTKLPTILLKLPFVEEPAPNSLAVRNLLRGQSFGLPSGQSVHRAVCEAAGTELPMPDLSSSELDLPKEFQQCTPLWLYVLAEGTLSGGQQLGPVGGRIVAETIIGLLEADNTSYLGSDRSWSPEFANGGVWDMPELLKYAGYAL